MGAVCASCVGRDKIHAEGTEIVRVVKYAWKAGKEEEVAVLSKELLQSLDDVIGLRDMFIGSDTKCLFGCQVWASQEDLDNYKKGLREDLLKKLKPVLDKQAYELCYKIEKGVKCASAVTDKSVVRAAGFKNKPNKAAEIDAFMEKAWPKMMGEGLSVYLVYKDDSKTEGVVAMLAPSQEHLDNYKKGLREELMKESAAQGIMDGGPTFEDVAPLLRP